jgi:hypothetical protein
MDDFKQNTKMKCEGSHYKKGGSIKKYGTGGDVTIAPAENALPSIQAQSREMQAKGVPANLTPEQIRAARMTRIADAFSNKPINKRTGGAVKRKK